MVTVPGGVTLLGGRKDTSQTILLVASFGAFLAFIDSTIVNVAFPSIQKSFPHSSIGDLSWVLNSYNVVFAAVLVAGGRVADLLGRRRTFAIGVAIFTLASGLCAMSGSVGELIAWRGLQAIGSALLVPASLAIVIEAFAEDRRSHAVGLWGAAAAFASGVGPPIGGALVGAGGWRWAFIINLPLGVAAIALSRKELLESRAPGRRTMPDVIGLALLAATIGALTTGIVKIPEWGTISSGVGIAFALSIALLVGFLVRSRGQRAPAIDPQLIRIPAFRLAIVLTVITGMGFYAYLLTHILWLRYVWHYSVLSCGLAVMPGALVATVVAAIGGKLADKHGARVLMVPGALIWAASFLWYLERVSPTPHFLSQWLPGQFLSGLGVGFTLPILTSAGLGAVPGGRYALASGLSSAARQLGGVLGIAILVVIVGTPSPTSTVEVFRHGWIFSACCFLAVAIGAIGVKEIAKRDVDDEHGEAVVLPDPVRAPREARPAPVFQTDGSVRSLLLAIPMFEGLSSETLGHLIRAAKTVELPGGEILFHAGDKGDALYVVRSGRIEILDVEGALLQTVGPGHVLGELALLTGKARAATIRARRDSSLVRLTKTAFERVINADAKASRSLASTLAVQIQNDRRAASAKGSPQPDVIAVVSDHAETSKQCADIIGAELQRLGRDVAHPRRVNAEQLLALEIATDHIVLDAGGLSRASNWREFCLRQADRVVVIAGCATNAEQLRALPHLRGVDLVIVGAEDRIDELRDASGAQTVAACPTSDTTDVARRLARRYCGHSVGLVLSGGGARAMAHLGVIIELEAAGVEVGRITGASMGAYIGALYAMGLPLTEIDARLHDEYVRRNPVGGYRLPVISISNGKAGHAMLDRSFADLRIEQMPRMYASSSVDLIASELVIHDRGLVRDAVGASISLPGVFPPYQLDGKILVDGGVLDNAPISPLTLRDEGPIILVDVVGRPSQNGAARVPGLAENLMRSLTIGSSQQGQRARDEATITIQPESRGVGLLEFHQMDRIVEAGRAAARDALREAGHLLV